MRQTLQSLFGFDLPTAQKWVIAFGVILVLLVLLGLFARQIKDGRLRMKGQGGGRTRQPRLGVVDIHDLDRQRQLVLIRRDNVEHLVMIGGPSDVVVETNIVRSGARTAMPAQPELGLPDRPLPFDSLVPPELMRQEPARQEPMRQEPMRQDAVRQEPQRADAIEEMRRGPPAPVAVAPSGAESLPPLPSRSPPRTVQTLTQAEAAVAAAAGGAAVMSALASTPAPASQVQPPNFARDHAPAPTASAVELDDMARQLDEALKRPFSAVRSSQAAAPVQASAQVQAGVPVEPAPTPKAAEPVVPSPPAKAERVPEPVANVPEPAPAARALPLDVEAELEMALGLKPERTSPKPDFATKPPAFVPPTPVEPAKAADRETTVALQPGPIEPKVAEHDLVPEDENRPQMGEHESEAISAETLTDVVTTGDRPAEMPPAPLSPEARFPEAPVPEAPLPEAPVPSAPAPDKTVAVDAEADAEPKPIDPFSVDAIEAEFARLLGREPKPRS